MKNLLSFFLFAALLSLTACKEIPPYINTQPDAAIEDTTYISSNVPMAQPRRIIIEEVTGVRCPNCPAAQLEAKNISNNNPGRVSIITLHPLNKLNVLTTPFDPARGDKHDSKFDFRTQAAAQIFEMVGISNVLPVGNVCRIKFPGELSANTDYQKWSAYASQELAKPTPLNIEVKANNVGDEVEVNVTVTFTQALSDSNYLSIAILESDMEDVQESRDQNGNTVYVEEYMHNHVLRAMMTGYFGDLLKGTYVPGRVFIKTYRLKRGADWNPANLEVVAFVHKDVITKEIVHAREVKVQ